MIKELIAITIKLPKEWVEHLETLKKETGEGKDFYVQKSLEKYLEDVEDLLIALKISKNKNKTYTTEELNKRLGL